MYAAHPLHFRRFAAVAVTWTTALRFKYVAANWPRATFTYRAHMRATSGTAFVRLFDVTDTGEEDQSTTNETSLDFVDGGEVTLTDGNEYRIDFGSPGGSTCRWLSIDVFMS